MVALSLFLKAFQIGYKLTFSRRLLELTTDGARDAMIPFLGFGAEEPEELYRQNPSFVAGGG